MPYANEAMGRVAPANDNETAPLAEIMDRTNERLRDCEEILDQLIFSILGKPSPATGHGPIENLLGAAVLGHETSHALLVKLSVLQRGIFPQGMK